MIFEDIRMEIMAEVLIGVCALLLIVLIITIINNIRLRRIMKNCSSGRLDETITEYYNKISDIKNDMDKREYELEFLGKKAGAGIKKFALVRYDAFDNISNNLSFSIALLDEENSGYVITSIYGREGSNLYVKPILYGKSKATMSDEEVMAYEEAIREYENKLK